jgi:hypothetical protein
LRARRPAPGDRPPVQRSQLRTLNPKPCSLSPTKIPVLLNTNPLNHPCGSGVPGGQPGERF